MGIHLYLARTRVDPSSTRNDSRGESADGRGGAMREEGKVEMVEVRGVHWIHLYVTTSLSF